MHTDNKKMCPLLTSLVARDAWLFNTNLPNNHYASVLHGFDKLENRLQSGHSEHTCILSTLTAGG